MSREKINNVKRTARLSPILPSSALPNFGSPSLLHLSSSSSLSDSPMASLFSGRASLGGSKRETTPPPATASIATLPSPFAADLSPTLSPSDLHETAYEILVASCRTSSGKPLSSLTNGASVNSPSSPSPSPSSAGGGTPPLQRSLTSAAASKMKKALGLRSSTSSLGLKRGGSSPKADGSPMSKSLTVGELLRVQMRVPETVDSRIRRAFLRVAASQLGKHVESLVLPLELLQQLKSSDFPNHQEYEAWQKRSFRILEAGLILHPCQPTGKADMAAQQRLQQIIRGALERPIETGKNNESIQVLRTTIMSLAGRSLNGSISDSCHWADGTPLNLRLYEIILEACFDINDESSIIEEFDELMELIKKTWGVLGINQMFHNLCFSWVLFNRFVSTGQTDNNLLSAAEGQLDEVAKDAKATKDPVYSKLLSATLTSILGWVEKRLLAYHDTFDSTNMGTMPNIVSLGVSAAKVLVEDISHEYRRKRKGEVDMMEKADSSRRATKNQPNPLPVLAILAKDVGELATQEKRVFSPILKRWHPLAAGVAMATLHACYGNELKQFISGISELTPDAVCVLRAADKLEQDLVQTAVEDSVDSEDGGKGVIREMPPYEAETVIANLVKIWIKTRVDKLKVSVDLNLQQEAWNPNSSQEGLAPSAVEVLRLVDETLDAYFQLPIPMHPMLLPDLVTGLDRCLQYYATKARSGCGSRNTFVPSIPALTRCSNGKKLGVFKKKDKSVNSQKRSSQIATNGDGSFSAPQICLRINTLQKIRTELEVVEKRIITHLRNSETATEEDFSNGLAKKFEATPSVCVEGIQQLSEALAYRTVFHDLSHALWDGLYVGEMSSSRIEPFIQELENSLLIISDTVNERARTRVITDIMKASFDGFLLVLLAGGPSRAFTKPDSQIMEDDFQSLKDLFWANGDGLSADLINKYSSTAREIVPLFKTDTESIIERLRRTTLEASGSSGRSRQPVPPTSGQWSPNEPNTLLRVLCYRNDEAATKFLKKTYNLPKKL
ncbi:hypothetical protein V2J09_011066 [Rumex salicifolius]